MINHDNGRCNVKHVYDPYKPDPIDVTGYKIVTTKKIKKDEQLYNSYNHCTICYELYDWVGTPEIFLQFGFVEPLPQRWLFDFARVKFDLDYKNEGKLRSDLAVNFLVPPSPKGIRLLQEELIRLKAFSELYRGLDHRSVGILANEWDLLWQYYDALFNAISSAVEQSKDVSTSNKVWELDDDWWVSNGTLLAADMDEHEVLPTINA